MSRGGARIGAGRRPKPVEAHVLAGTWRRDRHGPKPATVLTPPPPAPASGWTPSGADRASLSPRAGRWLDAVLGAYELDLLSGLRLLEALRTLSRLETLEARGSSPELTREAKLFLLQWNALSFEA